MERAKADKPTHGAAVFDYPGETFRTKLYPPYKGNRDPARRKELMPQMPFMRHAANALGFEAIECDGYEGDDVIATMAYRAKALGMRTTIVSSDKDFLQCVQDDVIEVVDFMPRPRKQLDGTVQMVRPRFLTADVKTKFGCTPAQVPDVQAILGDTVDNIDGIDGIGAKGAGTLISQFGSLEALLAAANSSGKVVGTPAIRKALRKGADDARLFKRLATLRTDVPLDIPMASLILHEPETSHIKEMLRVLEAGHKFDVLFNADPSLTIKVAASKDPMAWWRKSLKAKQPYIDEPQAGFYKRRLVVGGPWVPGRLWREPEIDFETEKPTGMFLMHCEVAGKPVNPLRAWDALSRMPIPQDEFDHRVAVGKWASEHDKTSSEANVDKPINWNEEAL